MPSLIFQPHEVLRPYIQHYTYLEEGIDGAWNPSQMYPTDCTVLSFARQCEQVSLREDNHSATRFEPMSFTGQATGFRAVHLHNRLRVFLVIFKPCGAYQLLGIPQNECIDSIINLRDLLDPSVKLLIEELSSQNNVQGLRRVMEKFLLQSLERVNKKERATRLSHVLEQIKQYNFINRDLITTICREYGYSLRGLERHMHEYVGIGPKRFLRIVRFNDLEYIRRMNYQCNWAQIAAQFGYTDQSHFIKEFKHFYGKTPARSAPDDSFISKTANPEQSV